MKKVVTLGGGTGTFVVLSALRELPDLELTAIVSSADDGGSTGHLRDAYGFLPSGDARQALVALAEDGNLLRDLFTYRFGKGNVAGHSLGNLFLTALTDVLGSDAAAIEEASRILRVRGTVLQNTTSATTLTAVLADGTHITGEHYLDERTDRAPVSSVSYETPVELSEPARVAIESADCIILGPGDLYTSTVAVLLAEGTKEAISASSAKLIYILNLFTKAGQTNGLSAREHVREITRYAGRAPDVVIVNSMPFTEDVLARYRDEGESPVEDDLGTADDVLRTDIASVHLVPPLPNDPVPRSLVRHDSAKLSQALQALLT